MQYYLFSNNLVYKLIYRKHYIDCITFDLVSCLELRFDKINLHGMKDVLLGLNCNYVSFDYM